jgi:hypothetical protein
MLCMPRASRAASGLPPQSLRAITQLGKDIALARRRRRLPQRLMAERMLEAGDPTVGLAVLASALLVLGMTSRLAGLVTPDTDRAGISEDLARLPKTTHAPGTHELDF